MNFLNSIKNKSKNSSDPFKYWEFKEPLTEEMIDEIYNAELDDPTKYDINYDGTRAIDGGEGKFREGLTDGGDTGKTEQINHSGLHQFLESPNASQSSSEILLKRFKTNSGVNSCLASSSLQQPSHDLSFHSA